MAESVESEWVEMIAPQTRERMFANIATGECVWKPPSGVIVKRAHANQWWELYDKNTDYNYYYNVARNQTVWQRPRDADIIPLTKLQALKERSMGTMDYKPAATQTMTKQFSVDQHSMRSMIASATSPQLSAKHRHSMRHSDARSDRSTDVSSVGSVSPVQLVGSSTDVYGYVHRGKPSKQVQRSLESHSSPRTCDILLDLERSSVRSQIPYSRGAGNDGPRTPDLMAKSYNFQGIARGIQSTSGMESDWKTNMEATYSDLASVQATPRPKPRAFPRTNPYVGVARADGHSTSHSGNDHYNHQNTYDYYSAQHEISSGMGPASPRNFEYSTLRSLRPTTSQSLSLDDANEYYPEFGRSCSPSHKVVPSRSSLSQPAGGHGVEPPYVNIPSAGLRGSSRDDGSFERKGWRAPDGSYIFDNVSSASGEVFINERAEFFDEASEKENKSNYAFNLFGMTKLVPVMTGIGNPSNGYQGDLLLEPAAGADDKEMDRLSNLSLGSNIFINTTVSNDVKAQKPSPQSAKASALGPPDLLHRAGIVGQKLAEANRSHRSESPMSLEMGRIKPVERSMSCDSRQLSEGNSSSSASFGTPALTRRYKVQDAPARLYSESDCDAYSGHDVPVGSVDNAELGSLTEFDLELFATTQLNDHRKGLLGRHLPVESLLTWTKDAIKKPIIRTGSKLVKKEAGEIFRRIQVYMGDRTVSSIRSSGTGSQLDVALEVVLRGLATVELRDEIFIQLCRQTTRNPQQDSLQRGLELLCICLAFFPPSSSFLPYLQLHLNCPLDNSIACVKPMVDCVRQCQRRLDRALQTGARKGLNKPTAEDISYARLSIYAPSMFGCTLTELMTMQKELFPTRRLPWIQTTLSEEILRLNGICTEGIFRVPGDSDAVNALKLQCDAWTMTPSSCLDPFVPASLLKLWYRELYEPLVPYEFYDECIENCSNIDGAISLIDRLPQINRDVLKYLIRFLQVFAAPENVLMNKMDVNNLAMVMAPNCLRSRVANPQAMLDNARHDMAFIKTLIQHLDTSDMDGIV